MVIKLVTLISVIMLFMIAALTSFTGGGQHVMTCIAGMFGLPAFAMWASRFTKRVPLAMA
ncbi:hypothetical protein [Gulbenkiania mobilis]|uniref:hypothetical protein n=1 Tax=Gulbenkiania mobilis TaxID=397457 RepID=UPI0006BBBBF5|nr:hypothetical protein [Gulbenkiania mobilis]